MSKFTFNPDLEFPVLRLAEEVVIGRLAAQDLVQIGVWKAKQTISC